MSKADEMFGKLGYKKGKTIDAEIKYEKDGDNIIIFFNKKFYKTSIYDNMGDMISAQELQAIYQFYKESGWL